MRETAVVQEGECLEVRLKLRGLRLVPKIGTSDAAGQAKIWPAEARCLPFGLG